MKVMGLHVLTDADLDRRDLEQRREWIEWLYTSQGLTPPPRMYDTLTVKFAVAAAERLPDSNSSRSSGDPPSPADVGDPETGYALEIRVKLGTDDSDVAEARAEKILAALEAEDVRPQFGEWVSSEVYTY